MTTRDPYLLQVQTDHVLDISGRIAELIRDELPDLASSHDRRCIAASSLAVAAQMLDRLDLVGGKPSAIIEGVTGALGSIGMTWMVECATNLAPPRKNDDR